MGALFRASDSFTLVWPFSASPDFIAPTRNYSRPAGHYGSSLAAWPERTASRSRKHMRWHRGRGEREQPGAAEEEEGKLLARVWMVVIFSGALPCLSLSACPARRQEATSASTPPLLTASSLIPEVAGSSK